jgi:AraC-like DNA-binding protein
MKGCLVTKFLKKVANTIDFKVQTNDMSTSIRELPFRQWHQAQPTLLWAYAGKVDPVGRHLMSMKTKRMTAWLITRGHVELLSDDNKITASSGWWIFFCGDFQKHDFSASAELVSVSLRLPENMEPIWRHPPFKFKASRDPRLEGTARRIIALIDTDPATDPVGPRLPNLPMSLEYFLKISSLGLEWSANYLAIREIEGLGISVPEKRSHPKVAQALKLLTNQSLAEGYSEARLAGEVGISTGHLEQLFVRELGITPRRLWEDHRRTEAAQRVRHSHNDLKRIAYELGFGSQSHFSNWFQKVFGSSPRRWRQTQTTYSNKT